MPTYEELRDAAVARPAPQAGQYAIVQPEAEAAEKLPLRERLKNLAALTLAAYSLLWKPLLCVFIGCGAAYGIVYLLFMR